jgi:hypothetical protein
MVVKSKLKGKRAVRLCKPDRSTSMPFMRTINPELIRFMIAAGVDVNEVTPDGTLPLRCVREMNEAVVEMLLDAGADPLRRPLYGQTDDLDGAIEVATQLAKTEKETPVAIRIRAQDASLGRASQEVAFSGERGVGPPLDIETDWSYTVRGLPHPVAWRGW